MEKQLRTLKVHRFALLSDAEMRAGESGTGELTGVPVKYGSLNDRGECFLKGAYAEDIPNFLQIGFNCDSHDWSYSGMIGFPIAARETDDGLESTFRFHSTDDAQQVRTKVQERIDAGKSVGLSQGFYFVDYFDIYPKQYSTELPKYFRQDQMQELMAYAATFPRIRVVRKAGIFEWSVVPAGSQDDAMATQVRSAELRAEYLGETVEADMTLWALSCLNDALFWRVLYPLLYDDTRTKADKMQILQAAIDEYSQLFLSTCDALLDDESASEDAGEEIRELFGEPDGDAYDPAKLRVYADSRVEARLTEHSDAVLSAAEGFRKRMERARSWRAHKRAGRELSEKNLNLLKEHRDSAQAIASGLGDLIDQVEAKTEARAPIMDRLLTSRLRSINPVTI